MNRSILTFKQIFKSNVSYVLILCMIIFTICIVYSPSSSENVKDTSKQPKPANDEKKSSNRKHVLCVLVAYRERFEQLLQFIPYMSKFLNRQSITYHIVIANHIPDGYRFNRGSSYNAGFLIIQKKFPECDYIALHDIDTLPLSDEIPYSYPGNIGFHLIPRGYHPIKIYSYPFYISGIFLISSEQFSRMNGYGNNFWGWGFEDYDFYLRLVKLSVPWGRLQPSDLSTDSTNSFAHLEHGGIASRDVLWCGNQANSAITRDRTDHTGLSDVNFTLTSQNTLTIDGFPVYVFNINIKCNFKITPWCRPFCVEMENITSPNSIFEFIDYSPKNQQIKLINLGSNRKFPVWDEIVDDDSSNKN